MKKIINTAFAYAIAAMAGGVFFREFTKFNNFTSKTTLSFVHTHLFILGMILFLTISCFYDKFELEKSKKFNLFYGVYNIGVPLTAIMLLVRGILQVLETPLSKGANAAISGVSGIGHTLIGVGIVFLFLAIKEQLKNIKN